MKDRVEVPLLVFDGDCGFCRLWVERWKGKTEGRVRYAPYQEVAQDFPEIPSEKFAQSVQLITPAGEMLSGARAVFQLLAYGPRGGGPLWVYQRIPGAAPVCEWCYRLVASHRSLFSRLTRLLWGDHLGPPAYNLSRWVFLRALGVVYLIAFLSLATQLTGLIGANGILPADQFLQEVERQFGAERYWYFPTLAWLSASDQFLQFLALGGAAAAALLIVGLAPIPALVVLWAFYLSLVTAGQNFLSFQWDALLLETGFLAIFLAPRQLFSNLARARPPSRVVVWLYRLLLFRLVFGSGIAKLMTGDPTWRSLTALTFHYETQPLPTPVAWYLHQLPAWFQKVSVVAMFGAELVVPFLFFAPRRLRFLGAFVTILFQLAIALSGNYTFFNLLTIVLCLLLFDDAAWRTCLPRRLAAAPGKAARSRPLLAGALSGLVLVVWSFQMVGTFSDQELPGWSRQVLGRVGPLQIVNNYGLFSVMTTSRPEIIIEGSNDGETWLEYEFRYKPGTVSRRPPWVAPHQPRLDWQLWFAALGSPRRNPWFGNLMVRLLEGAPEVLGLLERNPFPEAPPRYLRALVYEYRFSDPATRRGQGVWWQRELKGLYFPVVSLRR